MDNDSIIIEDPNYTLIASELMLGDLVRTKKGIVWVRSITLGGPILCGESKDPASWEEYSENEVRPIEITSAILEHNGFKGTSFERFEIKDGDRSLVLQFFPHRYKMCWKWMIPNNDPHSTSNRSDDAKCFCVGDISYVHELQHVLRIVGINLHF